MTDQHPNPLDILQLNGPPVFRPGVIVATPEVLKLIEEKTGSSDLAEARLMDMLRRHLSGDWGALDDEDTAANDRALKTGARLLSQYYVADARVWIITDAGHDDSRTPSVTTVLRPEDY